jgi:hypothetical protein
MGMRACRKRRREVSVENMKVEEFERELLADIGKTDSKSWANHVKREWAGLVRMGATYQAHFKLYRDSRADQRDKWLALDQDEGWQRHWFGAKCGTQRFRCMTPNIAQKVYALGNPHCQVWLLACSISHRLSLSMLPRAHLTFELARLFISDQIELPLEPNLGPGPAEVAPIERTTSHALWNCLADQAIAPCGIEPFEDYRALVRAEFAADFISPTRRGRSASPKREKVK